jgi:hypothetical protein
MEGRPKTTWFGRIRSTRLSGRNQQVLADSAIYRPTLSNLTGTDEPEQIRGEIVGASYFPLLGIKPVAGRSFLAEEDVTPEKGHGRHDQS